VQAAEITRAQTAERARLLRVTGYAVTLDLTRGGGLFGSESVITFDCAEPGAGSYADLIADRVHEISLNGARIDPAEAWAGGRIELAGLAARNELRVTADCRYSADGTGLHRSVDPADGRVYTYTKFEPAYARTVYANFEQPDLKAVFTIVVRVPGHWSVLSNQPGRPEPGDDGTTWWHFEPTPLLPTYLFAVVAGEYAVVRDTHTTPSGQVIPLGLACRQSLAGFLDAADIWATTRLGLDYYTTLFGRDYPFGKYDQAFVPEFSAGATESAACVIWTDAVLFRSKVTASMYELRASIVLHEMAHMWFGDLVTMRWWDDLWLNESFAEFCAALSSAEATRYTDAWATFAAGRKAWGYAQDQLPSTHPIAADVPTLSAAIANFDGISYAKGASVLRQLVARVGPDQFFTAIRAYFAQHAFGNATLTDLLQALEVSSGQSLRDWSDAWLKTTGPNTLRPEFELQPDGSFRTFAVMQEASDPDRTLRPHRIGIGLYSLDDGDRGNGGRSGPSGQALTRTHLVEADIAGPRTVVPELTGLPRPDLLLLNDGDLTYALLRFDDRSLQTLTTSIGALDDALARAVCWCSVIDMVRRAELAGPAFVAMVASGLGAEPLVATVQILAATAGSVLAQLADPGWVPEGRRQLAQVAADLLAAAEPGSDRQLAWAQLLSWTASSPDQLDLVAGLLAGQEEVAGLTVDTDLRWAMLLRLAAAGRAGRTAIEAELARDGTDAGVRHSAACRAAMPDPEAKAEAWRLLTETELPAGSVEEIAAGFYQPEQAELLAPYAARYLEILPALWTARGGHLRVRLAEALFPVTAAGPDLLAQIDAFLADGERDPGLVRVLAERRDQVRRAIASRALAG
jgi:aminopeptidase N